VTSLQESRSKESLDGLKAFEVRKVKNDVFVGLPTNIEQLAIDYYLFKLFLKANKVLKIKGVAVSSKYETTMPKNKDVEAFLQGFGLILITQSIPERKTKIRGMFGKGVSCAIKYCLSTFKDIDVNLLKLNKTEQAPQMVLGDSWGSKYVTEKRILDSIINAIKKSTYNFLNIGDWLQPITEINKRFGLDYEVLLNNPLLDEVERQWIRHDFKVDSFISLDEKKDSKIGSVGDLQEFTSIVKGKMKSLKPIKDFVNDIVSQRVKLAYQHPLNKALKKKGKGIDPLINNIRRTREYLTAYSIGRSSGMPRPFVCPPFPIDERDVGTFLNQVHAWERSYSQDQTYADRARQTANWLEASIAA
jgi:hypothetical protein